MGLALMSLTTPGRAKNLPHADSTDLPDLLSEDDGDDLADGLSAAPGYEFPDWGGVDHVGGGSHGSLHRSDSLGALLFCGVDAPAERAGGGWSIVDVAPMVLSHFGL